MVLSLPHCRSRDCLDQPCWSVVTLSVVLLVTAFLIGALTKLSFLLLAFCGNHSIPWLVAILSGAFILKLLLNHAVGGDNIQLLRYLLFGTHRLLQGTPARPRDVSRDAVCVQGLHLQGLHLAQSSVG